MLTLNINSFWGFCATLISCHVNYSYFHVYASFLMIILLWIMRNLALHHTHGILWEHVWFLISTLLISPHAPRPRITALIQSRAAHGTWTYACEHSSPLALHNIDAQILMALSLVGVHVLGFVDILETQAARSLFQKEFHGSRILSRLPQAMRFCGCIDMWLNFVSLNKNKKKQYHVSNSLTKVGLDWL